MVNFHTRISQYTYPKQDNNQRYCSSWCCPYHTTNKVGSKTITQGAGIYKIDPFVREQVPIVPGDLFFIIS